MLGCLTLPASQRGLGLTQHLGSSIFVAISGCSGHCWEISLQVVNEIVSQQGNVLKHKGW